jgi:hypothetical protein
MHCGPIYIYWRKTEKSSYSLYIFYYYNTQSVLQRYLSHTTDATVKVWFVLLPQLLSLAVCLGVAWGGSLGCINHPGNLYRLIGAAWTRGGGDSFKEDVRGQILAPHIPFGSISGSPVAGLLENELVTLEGPLLPTFICTICILIWGRAKLHNIVVCRPVVRQRQRNKQLYNSSS